MRSIPFVQLDDPRYGEAVQVAPLVRRVVADNPSKFTYHGTGTYIVGGTRPGDVVTVIDPGPNDEAHQDALTVALDGQQVAAILVTHCHADHSPLAAWMREWTGAPTVAAGPHPPTAEDIGEVPELAARPEKEPVKMEEAVDLAFAPDVTVGDGDVAAAGPGWTMRAVRTPGHTSNHTCFAFDEQRALFTGDHVMGWSTTVIGPPDGDMRAYFESLRKVIDRRDATLWPTHGAPVTDPEPFLAAFLEHRLEREAQVLGAVRAGLAGIGPMVARLYADVREELHKPAARSVLAHLVKLIADGVVSVDGDGPARLDSLYRPV